MKLLTGRDQKLARRFFTVLDLFAVAGIFWYAVALFNLGQVFAAVVCAIAGAALLFIHFVQMRNPHFPSRLW